ncbi:hypothetical protein [Bradyrhizobium japonicum]|uniref:hypothetical protein n=1 Tax=Bradyrhizobium japonicum TaxID=375 RepID=UPI003D1B41FF
MGMAERMNKLERGQRGLPRRQSARQRRHRRPQFRRQGAAHDAAVRGARGRRLSRRSPGSHRRIIIAGSILSARALAPLDLAIAHWKGFVAARQSWQRLNRLLQQMPAPAAQTLLQAPSKKLTVEV